MPSIGEERPTNLKSTEKIIILIEDQYDQSLNVSKFD